MEAEVRFVETARGSRVAYAVVGTGPPNLLVGPASVALEPLETRPGWLSCATYARKIEYDHSGNGRSVDGPRDYSFDGLYEEFRAVAEVASPDEPLILVGSYSTGPLAIRFAAEHPDRVRRLVLHNSWAHGEDYLGQRGWAEFREALGGDWNTGTNLFTRIAGGNTGAAARQMAAVLASTVDQESYLAFVDAIREHDATRYLSHVTVPTAVVFNPNMTFALEPTARLLASRIEGATLSAAPPFPKRGGDNTPFERAAKRWVLGEAASATETDDADASLRGEVELTSREVDVLLLVAAGLKNRQIAERLSIQPSTVARHVHHLLQKTDCTTRTELTAHAHRTGLV